MKCYDHHNYRLSQWTSTVRHRPVLNIPHPAALYRLSNSWRLSHTTLVSILPGSNVLPCSNGLRSNDKRDMPTMLNEKLNSDFIFLQDKYTIEKTGRSILTYTPATDTDYGSLACRANNMAGQQIEPCRYTLLPAVKPEPPTNCSTLNLTDDSAELRCLAGKLANYFF